MDPGKRFGDRNHNRPDRPARQSPPMPFCVSFRAHLAPTKLMVTLATTMTISSVRRLYWKRQRPKRGFGDSFNSCSSGFPFESHRGAPCANSLPMGRILLSAIDIGDFPAQSSSSLRTAVADPVHDLVTSMTMTVTAASELDLCQVASNPLSNVQFGKLLYEVYVLTTAT